VRSMIVRDGGRLAAFGVALGCAGAVATTRFLRTLLFEISATEPLVFAGAAAVLAIVALAASWMPAHAATKVEPLEAVRGTEGTVAGAWGWGGGGLGAPPAARGPPRGGGAAPPRRGRPAASWPSRRVVAVPPRRGRPAASWHGLKAVPYFATAGCTAASVAR